MSFSEHIPQRAPQNPEADKALRTEWKKLMSGEFAQSSPLLQLLLTVRMIYENPKLVADNHRDLDAKYSMAVYRAARNYIVEHDQAFDEVRHNPGKWKGLMRRLKREKELTGSLLSIIETAFGSGTYLGGKEMGGKEVARLSANFNGIEEILQRSKQHKTRVRRDPDEALPTPYEALGASIRSQSKLARFRFQVALAAHRIPGDFCKDARIVFNRAADQEIG